MLFSPEQLVVFFLAFLTRACCGQVVGPRLCNKHRKIHCFLLSLATCRWQQEMADPDLKIELGSFVPHFIIYVLWKTPRRQMERERGKMACAEGSWGDCWRASSHREKFLSQSGFQTWVLPVILKNVMLLMQAVFKARHHRSMNAKNKRSPSGHIIQDWYQKWNLSNCNPPLFFLLHSTVFFFCSPQPACVAALLSSITTGSAVWAFHCMSERKLTSFLTHVKVINYLSTTSHLRLWPPHHPHNPTLKCYTLLLNNNHNNNLVKRGNIALLYHCWAHFGQVKNKWSHITHNAT